MCLMGLRRDMNNELICEKAVSERLCRVLLVYESMIPSVRLCGDGQLGELATQGKIEYRRRQTLRIRWADIAWADVAVLCRLDTCLGLCVARRLRNAKRYLIYMLDDDLLAVPMGLSVSAYYSREDIRNNILGMMRLSNALLSTSERILRKYCGEHQRMLRMDGYAEPCFEFKEHDGLVKIGFAGSLDRLPDVDVILHEALLRIHERYGERVHFQFLGVSPAWAWEIEAQSFPYMDSYEKYRKTLADLAWDIGLAPMADTPFHACKYINKYIEYASTATAGVFSDVPPYSNAITQEMGVGALCENSAQAWYDALSRLIEDDTYRERCRMQANKYVRREMNLKSVTDRFLVQTHDIFAWRAEPAPRQKTLVLDKAQYLFQKGRAVFARYGLRLPVVMWRRLIKHE